MPAKTSMSRFFTRVTGCSVPCFALRPGMVMSTCSCSRRAASSRSRRRSSIAETRSSMARRSSLICAPNAGRSLSGSSLSFLYNAPTRPVFPRNVIFASYSAWLSPAAANFSAASCKISSNDLSISVLQNKKYAPCLRIGRIDRGTTYLRAPGGAPHSPLTRETAALEVLFGTAAGGGIPHVPAQGSFSLRIPLSDARRCVRLFRFKAFSSLYSAARALSNDFAEVFRTDQALVS